MEPIYAILMAGGAFVVAGAASALIFRKIGYNARKRVAEKEIGSAEEEAKKGCASSIGVSVLSLTAVLGMGAIVAQKRKR